MGGKRTFPLASFGMRTPKLPDLGTFIAVLVTVDALCGCSGGAGHANQDDIIAALEKEAGRPVKLASAATANGVTCGYVTDEGGRLVSGEVFLFERGQLKFFREHPDAFKRCPKGWVAPHVVQPVY